MKRWFVAGMLALAFAGLVGCDEEGDAGGNPVGRLNGTWNGTMVATELMGRPAEDSDVVPATLIFEETSSSHATTTFKLVFQANGIPGLFTGQMDHASLDIQFISNADYTYTFEGRVNDAFNSMSGTWTVNIPGGMSGTWQASR